MAEAAVGPVRAVVDEVRALAALAETAQTRGDCEVLCVDVRDLAGREQARVKSRTRAVARLEEAAIHLARAGVLVGHGRAVRLAAAALTAAADGLEVAS